MDDGSNDAKLAAFNNAVCQLLSAANGMMLFVVSVCPWHARRVSRRNISLVGSNDQADETILLMSTHNIDSFWYMSTIRPACTQAIMVPLGPNTHCARLVWQVYDATHDVGRSVSSGRATDRLLHSAL